jgi:hypothetical protein
MARTGTIKKYDRAQGQGIITFDEPAGSRDGFGVRNEIGFSVVPEIGINKDFAVNKKVSFDWLEPATVASNVEVI